MNGIELVIPEEFQVKLKKMQVSEKFFDVQVISIDKLIVTPKVRLKCKYGCENFDRKRNCPQQDTFTPEECINYLKEYQKMLLIRFSPTAEYLPPKTTQVALLEIERQAMLFNYRFALAVYPTHCQQCEECDISIPCGNPLKSRPSVSSLCIDIMGTLERIGLGQQILTNSANPEKFYYVGLVFLD